MKKLMIASMAVLVSVGVAFAYIDPTSTGTVIGNGYIGANCTNCIAIGAGSTSATNSSGLAYIPAGSTGRVQIGNGSNITDNTLNLAGVGYMCLTNQSPLSAALLTAGTAASAINGAAITNLAAANMPAGTFPGAMTISGATTLSSTLGAGATTVTTLHATGAATLDTTALITGVATFTAQPRFNAAAGTPGAVTGLLTNGPTSMVTTPVWLSVNIAGASYWVPCFHQ